MKICSMVYEISYFKRKYPLGYKILSRIIPIFSIIFILLVFIAGYLSVHYPKSIWFYILFTIIIIFYIWWIIRGFEYVFLLISGYARYKSFQKINFTNIFKQKPTTKQEKILYKKYLNSDLKIDEIYHWVIIPTFQDPYDMLEDSFQSIKNSTFDNKKIIVTLAGEQADEQNFRKIEKQFLEKYKDTFFYVNTTLHPKGLEGELPGKGSNVTYAAKSTYKDLLKLGLDENNIIVSVMDSESIVQNTYFQAIGLEYILTDKNMRDKTIYQPMLFLFNRFFKSPFFSKVIALSTTFYILAASIKGIGTRAQAVQAQSLKSLMQVDFYSVETITEDGHQYYRTYCAFDGKFQVHPVYTYVLLEPVIGQNIFESFKLQFNQIKRWAHGMLDFPYIVLCMFENEKLPKMRTLYEIFRLMEVSVLWGSLQFVLFFGTIYFSILGGEYTSLLQIITVLGLLILVIVMFITFTFLPWNDLKKKRYRVLEASKYILFSFTIMGPLLFILNGLPALYAQILVLIGKPMGKFNVTKKYRD